MLGLLSTARFFVFRRDFCLVMSKMEALFVQDLINLYDAADDSCVDEDGFFLCTTNFLENGNLPWSVDEQKRMFIALEPAPEDCKDEEERAKYKGYVEKRLSKTTPPQRWVRIDVEKLNKDVKKALEEREPRRKKKWRNKGK